MSASKEQWEQLGKALTSNAEALSVLDIGNEEGQTFTNLTKNFQFLIDHSFVDGHNSTGIHATKILDDMSLNLSLVEARRSQVEDIQDWFERLQIHIDRYLDKDQKERQGEVLKDIKKSVVIMKGDLKQETENLQYLVRTEFGYVDSLSQKLIENKYYSRRTTKLVKQITFMTAGELLKMACGDTLIWRILDGLENSINSIVNDLGEIISQLDNMMWSFKKKNERARLLWAIDKHIKNGEAILDVELDEEELMDSPFNVKAKGKITAFIDIDSENLSDQLVNVVENLPNKDVKELISVLANKVGVYDEDGSKEKIIKKKDNPFLKHRKEFFKKSLEGRICASQYWDSNGDMDLPFESWLIWIHRNILSMNTKSIENAHLNVVKDDFDQFDGVIIIRDLSIDSYKQKRVA